MATVFRAVGASSGTVKSVFAYLTAATRFMTFESPDGTDYAVTAAKTFKITRVIYSSEETAAGISIGYGDDGVAEGAAAPTTPKYVLGNGTVAYWYHGDSVDRPVIHDTYAEIPAGKYPFVKSYTGKGRVQLIGIEE